MHVSVQETLGNSWKSQWLTDVCCPNKSLPKCNLKNTVAFEVVVAQDKANDCEEKAVEEPFPA